MIRIIERPESREWLQHQGAEPAPGTPEQLAERVRSDVARIKKLLADTHLKLN
jgi:tripartite-type tricarboxylate transporter receptor subunit TctC